MKTALLNYRKLDIELKCVEEQYERLKADLESPRRSILSDTSKGTNPMDMGDKIIKLIELKETYALRLEDIIKTRLQVEKTIDSVEDPLQRSILRYRYIDGMTWDKICHNIGYEWAQVHRLHNKAILYINTKK